MCLNETYIKVRIGRNVPNAFPIQKGVKEGAVLFLSIFKFPLIYAIWKPKKIKNVWNRMKHIMSWSVVKMLKQ